MVADHAIEREIRRQISRMDREDPAGVTVNSVRTQVEQQLELPSGFLKSGAWKARSKEIIKDVFDAHEPDSHPEPSDAGRRQRSSGSIDVKSQKRRKSATQETASKRQKKSAPDSAESVSSSHVTDPAGSASDSDVADGQRAEQQDRLLNDSELSDVIDEEPVKAKKRASKPAPKASVKGAKRDPKAEKKKKADAQLSTQQVEMKTLQSQLVKCGIRRVWGNELKKFDSDKAKISHLKGMLRDVGMEGRFSEDKARKIKEEREFKADLAEIRQGNEKWGKGKDEDDDEDEDDVEARGRPRRRIARGLAQLDVFAEDEESE